MVLTLWDRVGPSLPFSQSIYLCLQDDFGDGWLDDVGAVQAVDAVDTEHTKLVTDHTLLVHPEMNKNIFLMVKDKN